MEGVSVVWRDVALMDVYTFNFVIFLNYYQCRVWCLSLCFISASILVIGLILNVIEVNCELGKDFRVNKMGLWCFIAKKIFLFISDCIVLLVVILGIRA